MNIIIPMAGMGKRLRPHTLTVPKPLVPVAGKPIVQHLVEDIAKLVDDKLNKIVFVTGKLDPETEQSLIDLAASLGADGEIAYQEEALGTAHAIWCAKSALSGKTIVAFADTLFKADFKIDESKDGVIWVKQIDNPSAFGVVQLDEEGIITDYVEKPESFISDLAMIGIYYFKNGEDLHTEIKYLIDNEIIKSGEYQLPDALKRLKDKGGQFVPGKVDAWMDCGNPSATIDTNSQVLKFKHPESFIHSEADIKNSIVIDPCYIGKGSVLKNSVVGPFVSVGNDSILKNVRIENSIIQSDSRLENFVSDNSMIGNHVEISCKSQSFNLGDYNTIG